MLMGNRIALAIAAEGLVELTDDAGAIFLPAGSYLPTGVLLSRLAEQLKAPVGSGALRRVLEAEPALPRGIAIGSRKLWKPGDVEPLAEGLRRELWRARRLL